MSFVIIDKIIKNNQLNMTDKMVFIAIASFSNDTGCNIFPSHERIAERASVHKRTVIRSIQNLIEKGFLFKKSVFNENLKRPNQYYINMCMLQCDTESYRCDRESQGVVTLCHYPSDTESHKHTNEHTIINKPINKSLKSKKGIDCLQEFEEFWRHCPKKIGKAAAFKAYKKAIKKAAPSEILNGMILYAEKAIEPRFIKHPSGWLNDERWLDEHIQEDFTNPSEKGSYDGTFNKKTSLSDKHRAEAIEFQSYLDKKYGSTVIQ